MAAEIDEIAKRRYIELSKQQAAYGVATPADAALEIERFGSTVLRGVWTPGQIATLHDAITGFCARRAATTAFAGMVGALAVKKCPVHCT